MYNEERKKRFVQEENDRNKQLEYNALRLFERIGGKEEVLQKDLCEFTVSEITGAYKEKGISSLETLMMINSYYRIYTDWCLKNGYVSDGQNHYAELNYDLLQKKCVNLWIKDKQIYTRKELLDFCKKLDNDGDKFIILGIFEGICGVQCREIANVSMNDLQGDTIHTVDGRDVKVSKELRTFLQNACDEYTYTPYKENGVREEYFYDKSDPRAVKRMYNSPPVETQNALRTRVGTRLRRINNRFGIDIGTKSLLYSGVIDYINGKLEEDKKLTPYDCIKLNKDYIESKWLNIASVKRFCLKFEKYFIR